MVRRNGPLFHNNNFLPYRVVMKSKLNIAGITVRWFSGDDRFSEHISVEDNVTSHMCDLFINNLCVFCRYSMKI